MPVGALLQSLALVEREMVPLQQLGYSVELDKVLNVLLLHQSFDRYVELAHFVKPASAAILFCTATDETATECLNQIID